MLTAMLATLAIVTQDQTALRAAPRADATPQAVLAQGDALEVRGRKLDHLQVWDHRHERAGYVRASQVRLTTLAPAEAPELLAVLRFLRDSPGQEALGIAYTAAYLQAVPAERLDAEPFDAIGTMADRLARRAAPRGGTAMAAPVGSQAVTQHLAVAAHHGVQIQGVDHAGALQPCYDGDAFRRVLALPSATSEQRARAALGLTRHECVNSLQSPATRLPLDQWRAQVLDTLSAAQFSQLPEGQRNRLRLRRAGVWAAIAFQQARRDELTAATAAAQRALGELAAIDKTELTEEDRIEYHDAAIRVGASRWAAEPVPVPEAAPKAVGLAVRTRAGAQPGETCVLLVDSRRPTAPALAQRCTFGQVWPASARADAASKQLALAVQPLAAWRELWLFRRQGDAWVIDVLPPAAAEPGLGYVEFAGWVPGGERLLLARESRVEGASGGRARRSFEVLKLDSLQAEKSAGTPDALALFGRWQDAAWKRQTVSLR